MNGIDTIKTSGRAEDVARERPFLLRLARLQLASDADAEDVVQETLVAALRGADSYAGQSTLRSWLTGILRHKIVDAIRARRVHLWSSEAAQEQQNDNGADIDAWFTDDDAWHPEHFADHMCGAALTARRQLLDIVELCLNRLPEQTARMFLMREYLGMDLPDIEQHCAVSSGNLRVILYRARMRLRDCAVRGWGELE